MGRLGERRRQPRGDAPAPRRYRDRQGEQRKRGKYITCPCILRKVIKNYIVIDGVTSQLCYPISDFEIHKAISAIISRDAAMVITLDMPWMGTSKPSEYSWNLMVTGDKYNIDYARTFGRIRLNCPPYRDLLMYNGNKILDIPCPNMTYRNMVSPVISGLEELFIKCVGLGSDNNSNICYATLGLDIYSLTPFACSMVFHREINNFALDYNRLYRQYYQDFTMEEMLRNLPNVDPSCVNRNYITRRINRINIIKKAYSDVTSNVDIGLLQFIQSLTIERSLYYSNMSKEFIRHTLTNLPLSLCVNTYDFGDNGIMLSSDPLTSVWRAYQYLAECYDSQ